MVKKEGDELARLPYLRTWFRTRSAIVLHLSNGTLQINFFNVSSKRIIFGFKSLLKLPFFIKLFLGFQQVSKHFLEGKHYVELIGNFFFIISVKSYHATLNIVF